MKKRREDRKTWKHLINRLTSRNKLWLPSKDSRVCSEHFVDGEPSIKNSFPTEYLGYNSTSQVKNIATPCSKRRKLSFHREGSHEQGANASELMYVDPDDDVQNISEDVPTNELRHKSPEGPEELDEVVLSTSNDNASDIAEIDDLSVNGHQVDLNTPQQIHQVTEHTCTLPHEQGQDDGSGQTEDIFVDDTTFSQNDHSNKTVENSEDHQEDDLTVNNTDGKTHNYPLFGFGLILLFLSFLNQKKTILTLNSKLKELEREKESCLQKIQQLQNELSTCSCRKPVHKVLMKTDDDAQFFTGISSIALFHKLHDFIASFVKRRWKGAKGLVTPRRLNKDFGRKRGPKRKLCSKDELLLTMTRLRLGLLLKDLASRFKISTCLCSQIFQCWIRAMAKVLKPMVYMPNQGILNVTSPKRFDSIRNIHSIIDCSELFIETPQAHDLQASTWSTYKHHNTLKYLIGVSPNSFIVYVSKAYTGRVSDKEITVLTEYLDTVPPYSVVMCDKGFNINEECAARRISLYVPPGKRGMSQMGNAEVSRTNRIAKLRILVEQVIRRMKCFRILSTELPLSLIPSVDDILIICAALSNMKEPIFKD